MENMLLVDILAREMKVWPVALGHAVGQAADGTLHCETEPEDAEIVRTTERYTLCEDFMRAIVTRAEWQAAVDALKAEQAAELKWPDGATHYVPPQEENENGVFYLVVNDDAVYGWSLLKSGVDNGARVYGESKRHQLPGAILRPTERAVEWDGVSVPPAGTECEYRVGRGGWFKCSIRYVTTPYRDCPVEVVMYANHLGGEQTGVAGSGEGELEFRSIRTQEQIAAEEREEAIRQICIDAGSPELTPGQMKVAEKIYLAGYRKQVEK